MEYVLYVKEECLFKFKFLIKGLKWRIVMILFILVGEEWYFF